MRKYLLIAMALVLMSGRVWAEDYVPCADEENCWQCGDTCSARLDENDTLTVSGQGKMWGYNATTRYETPWFEDRLKIKKVVVDDGIENIGQWAFYGCGSIETVNLSQSVKTVDHYAFDEDSRVQHISMYDTTVWSYQDNFDEDIPDIDVQIHCYGDYKTCQSNFLEKVGTHCKGKPRFILRGTKIYTVEEAMEVTKNGDKFHVFLTYK